MVGERELLGPLEVVPLVSVRRADRIVRLELVHAVAGGAALGGDRTGEHVEEEQAAGDLPAAHVAGAGGTPVVAGELGRVGADDRRDLADRVGVDAGLLFGGLGGVLGVLLEQRLAQLRELDRLPGRPLLEVGLPVDPALDELGVPLLGLDQQTSDREQQERLGAGPGRQPVVGLGAGVRQARVARDDLGAVGLGFDDALGVRVEVVARLEVRGDQEDHLGVGEVGAGPIVAHPALVADAGVAGADVGVAVVAVDAPRLEDTVGVALFARTADVVHHAVLAAFDERGADLLPDLGERLVPGDALPLARAPLADATQGEHDPLGVVDLVDRGRTLGAVAAPAARVMRVALDLADLAGLLVVVGDEATAGFTVEAGGGDEGVVLLDLVGPGLGVEFGPVVPLLGRRVLVEVGHRSVSFGDGVSAAGDQDRGTDWPARTKASS